MNKDNLSNRVLIIVSVIFILIVGAIFFVVTGGNLGGSGKKGTQIEISDTSPARSVRLTVTGPIVADENRSGYSIEISADQRAVTRTQGYQSEVVAQQSYINNPQAYSEFVHALGRARADEARTQTGRAAEEVGACASGTRYAVEILNNGQSIQRLWTTTCSGARGTLSGPIDTIHSLFDKQIPDLSTVLKGSRL